MNRLHRLYCQSKRWKRQLELEILPWLLEGIDPGAEVLELGPGPGLTTDWLRRRSRRVIGIEADFGLAKSLRRRTDSTNVNVLCGDATALPYRDQAFSCVVAFTMLHHVPSPVLQDRLFAEAHRVLRSNGVFAGADILPSLLMRAAHLGDTVAFVDPTSLSARLESVGFREVKIETGAGRFRFSARRKSRTQAGRMLKDPQLSC
jgi:SAM-dependent methyltransferase